MNVLGVTGLNGPRGRRPHRVGFRDRAFGSGRDLDLVTSRIQVPCLPGFPGWDAGVGPAAPVVIVGRQPYVTRAGHDLDRERPSRRISYGGWAFVRLGCLCVEEACDQGAEQLLESVFEVDVRPGEYGVLGIHRGHARCRVRDGPQPGRDDERGCDRLATVPAVEVGHLSGDCGSEVVDLVQADQVMDQLAVPAQDDLLGQFTRDVPLPRPKHHRFARLFRGRPRAA